jgi:hypothetical protein
MYDGKYLFGKVPLGDIRSVFKDPYTLIGKKFNKRTVYTFDKHQLKFTFSYDQWDSEQRRDFYDFFTIHKGKTKNFFVRTFLCTIEVAAPYASGDTDMTIRDIDYDLRWLSLVNSVYVYTVGFNKIPAIVNVGPGPYTGTQKLYFDVPGGKSLNPGDMLEFVFDVRFDSDTLDIKMVDIEYSTIDLTMITAKEHV